MPSLRPQKRPVVVGLALGALLAVAALFSTWRLVRDDARRAEAAGYVSRGAYAFVGGMSAIAAVVGYLAGHRLGRGRVTRTSGWVLTMTRAAPETYRDAEAPNLGRLLERLAVHGYQLEVRRLGAGGPTSERADLHAALVGGGFWLHDRGLGAPDTGVALRIDADADRDHRGLGTVQAIDAGRVAGNAELALFVIVELGELVPDLRYRADDSRLSPDTAHLLRAALPERPRRR